MIVEFSGGDLISFNKKFFSYAKHETLPTDGVIYLALDVISYISSSHPDRKCVGRTLRVEDDGINVVHENNIHVRVMCPNGSVVWISTHSGHVDIVSENEK